MGGGRVDGGTCQVVNDRHYVVCTGKIRRSLLLLRAGRLGYDERHVPGRFQATSSSTPEPSRA